MRVILIVLFLFLQSCADDTDRFEVEIALVNHRFVPHQIKVPAGRKIKLLVTNNDDTVEEFESYELRREKIVPPHGRVTVLLAPLKPGKYSFFGEFHEDTAQGYLIVEEENKGAS